MKKVALVFVVAVILPSLVLAWLAVRSLRDQQFLLERQQSLLDQRVTDALAQNISDYLAQRQQEFSSQVESLATNQNAQTLAAQFDDQIRQRWPLAEVGFCVTLAGKILSPPPNARPAAQMASMAASAVAVSSRLSSSASWVAAAATSRRSSSAASPAGAGCGPPSADSGAVSRPAAGTLPSGMPACGTASSPGVVSSAGAAALLAAGS